MLDPVCDTIGYRNYLPTGKRFMGHQHHVNSDFDGLEFIPACVKRNRVSVSWRGMTGQIREY